MSRPRDLIVTALAPLEDLDPTVRVIPYARTIDPPAVPTVMVRVDRVEPAAARAGARRVRSYTFAVIVVPAKSTGDAADAEIDALLEDVLAVLDDAPDLTWTAAERGTYQDTAFPAYEVTVTQPLKIGA